MALSSDNSSFSMVCSNILLKHTRVNIPNIRGILGTLTTVNTLVTCNISIGTTFNILTTVGRLPREEFRHIQLKYNTRIISSCSRRPIRVGTLVRATHLFGTGELEIIFRPRHCAEAETLVGGFPTTFSKYSRLVLLPICTTSRRPLRNNAATSLCTEVQRIYNTIIPVLTHSIGRITSCCTSPVNTLESKSVLLIINTNSVMSLMNRLATQYARTVRRHSSDRISLHISCNVQLYTSSSYRITSRKTLYRLLTGNMEPLGLFNVKAGLLPPPLNIHKDIIQLMGHSLAVNTSNAIRYNTKLSNTTLLTHLHSTKLSNLRFVTKVPNAINN